MIDHIMLRVRDVAKSRAFYLAAFAPLGYGVAMEFGPQVGFGPGTRPQFWIAEEGGPPHEHMHLAFSAKDRKAVDAFYAAAIAAGGKDNGAPGLRPDYHPGYYGAFVLDPDGHNVEAVTHRPE